MFQPGTYQIEKIVNSEASPYGFLEVEQTGADTYSLKFYSEDSKAAWPLPAPTSSTSYTFVNYSGGLPNQVGDGTMEATGWPGQEFTATGKEREVGPGPLIIELDGTKVSIAVNDEAGEVYTGYFGLAPGQSDWPLAIPSGSTAALLPSAAETPTAVIAACNAEWGEDWTRHGLSETYSA